MNYIYALVDPRNYEIRYIGKSIYPNIRYKQHLKDITYNPHKQHWIKMLASLGLQPLLEILEEVDNDNWQDIEIWYIEETKKCGHRLLNMTSGGDGLLNVSDETKEKLRLKMIGNRNAVGNINSGMRGHRHSEETKNKIRIANSRPKTVEHKKKLSENFKNYFASPKGKTTRENFIRKFAGQKVREKLEKQEVINIRLSTETNGVLAQRYNVSTCTISNVRNYKTYLDVINV